jgi:hypothetical protein
LLWTCVDRRWHRLSKGTKRSGSATSAAWSSRDSSSAAPSPVEPPELIPGADVPPGTTRALSVHPGQ